MPALRSLTSPGLPGSHRGSAHSRSLAVKVTAGQAAKSRRAQRTHKRLEQEWEGELRPGSSAAKPPQLHLQQASSALARTSGRGLSADLAELAPTEDLPAPLAAINGWLYKLLGKRWEELPSRYKLVFATSMGFVLCNMDKVNISVAIIPMAQDFGWSPTMSGVVQSSFFFGYMLTQIPGGYVISKMGGRRILPAGVGLWSAATAAVPLLAGTVPGLFASRAAVGLGEGVAPSSATDMVARLISKEERSRAMSFIFGGLPVGSLLGLLVAPPLIEKFGWATVFYAFGGLGFLWVLWFEYIQNRIADRDPETAAKLSGYAQNNSSVAVSATSSDATKQDAVPWRGFLRNGPVQALAYTHFCNNWFHYTMMAWLPTYFVDTMSLNITQAAQLSLLPPIAAIAASAVAGTAGDALIARGMPVAHVRKLAQCTAFLGPALCLLGATYTESSTATVAFITAALGLASFSLAGLYCNHADLSPRYAPVLLGLTNTSGAVPGIIGVTISGALYDQTGSWPLALFAPSIFFFVTGSAVFALAGRSELQDFGYNAPFAFEKPFQSVAEKLLPSKQVRLQVNAVRSRIQPIAEVAAVKVATAGNKLRSLLKRKQL